MAKSDIWMKLYIGDYLADTQALTAEQHGSYLLLLMSYYRTGPLPNDAKKLSQVARATIKKWNTISDTVMSFFYLAEDALWHHKRADSEMGKSRQPVDEGAAGGGSRWGDSNDELRGRELRSQRLSEARRKGTHTDKEWRDLLDFHGGICVRCKKPGPIVKDHITPIYKGGSDAIQNLQPLCRHCNSSKGPETTDFRFPGWENALLENASKNASEMPGSQKLEVRSHKEQPQKQRPSRSRKGERVPDPRHGEFREAFRAYFLYKNTGVEQEPWDAQEAAQLSRFLAKNPNFTTEQWKRLLKNRAGSRVAHGENLSSWVGRALTWATAPNQSNGGFTDAKPTIADNLAAKQGTVDARAARRVALEPDNPGRILEAGSASVGADGDRRALGPLLEAAR